MSETITISSRRTLMVSYTFDVIIMLDGIGVSVSNFQSIYPFPSIVTVRFTN